MPLEFLAEKLLFLISVDKVDVWLKSYLKVVTQSYPQGSFLKFVNMIGYILTMRGNKFIHDD